MISTNEHKRLIDLTSAEVKEGIDAEGSPKVTITSGKRQAPFIVSKDHTGYALFKVTAPNGKLPPKLMGSYTRMNYAVADVLAYLKTATLTQVAKRNANTEAREAQKKVG